MSSRYNKRRKVQPTPPFCYSKKPGRENLIPCPDGPSIGPTPRALVKLSIPNPSGIRSLLFDGQLQRTPPQTRWNGVLQNQAGDLIRFTFLFDCQQQTWTWEILQIHGPWPIQPAWGVQNNLYKGPRQLDTSWNEATAPIQNPNWTASLRVSL